MLERELRPGVLRGEVAAAVREQRHPQHMEDSGNDRSGHDGMEQPPPVAFRSCPYRVGGAWRLECGGHRPAALSASPLWDSWGAGDIRPMINDRGPKGKSSEL